ncbi:MAG: outer membrane beta-barrel protein [Nitrospiraceae bacterium]
MTRRPRLSTVLSWIWVAAGITVAFSAAETSALAGEKDDVYISLYALGSWPADRDAMVRGAAASGTRLENGVGAGIKVAIFPEVTKRMVGIELESYGHGTEISFALGSGHGPSTRGATDLIVMNSMINVVARYPGAAIQPYGGVGIGVSQGYVHGADIPGRADRDFESSTAFGHQFLAGLQVTLSPRLFAFGEYKYFSANYHWAGLSLDFRAQYAVLGVGMRF